MVMYSMGPQPATPRTRTAMRERLRVDIVANVPFVGGLNQETLREPSGARRGAAASLWRAACRLDQEARGRLPCSHSANPTTTMAQATPMAVTTSAQASLPSLAEAAWPAFHCVKLPDANSRPRQVM